MVGTWDVPIPPMILATSCLRLVWCGRSEPISAFAGGTVIEAATHQQARLVRREVEIELLLAILLHDFEDPLQGIHILEVSLLRCVVEELVSLGIVELEVARVETPV